MDYHPFVLILKLPQIWPVGTLSRGLLCAFDTSLLSELEALLPLPMRGLLLLVLWEEHVRQGVAGPCSYSPDLPLTAFPASPPPRAMDAAE